MNMLTSDDDVEHQHQHQRSGNTDSIAFDGSSNRSTSSWGKNSDGETASSRSHVSEHDQLPNVEEIRMNAAGSTRSRRSTVALLIIGTLVVVGAVIVAVALVLANSDTEDNEFPMEFTGNEGSNTFGTPTTSAPVTSTPFTNAPVETVTSGPEQSTTTTSAPESREVKLLKLLTGAGVSTMESLVAENSPQNKAAKWLADVDTFALDLDAPDMKAVVQRYAMAVIYYSTGGEAWPNQLNFLTGDHECQWFLKAFDGDQKTIRQYGITCNEDGTTIQALHFPSNFLTGSFPAETRHLEDLEKFEAFNNPGLTDGFPTFFETLKKISYIGLHYCALAGELPEWLGSLTTLKSLVLSNNEFTGTLPSNLNQLTLLENLYLDDNKLKGPIAMLNRLSAMRNLVLEDNQFEGSVTQDMVSTWGQMETLDISDNLLTGSLPSNLFTLSKLRVLDLNGNHFSGPIPKFTVVEESTLEILTLNMNKLEGEIPYELGQYSNLKHLDLTGNKLSSTIPASFVQLSHLEFLYMANNPFTEAEVPAFLSVMTSLMELSLKNTSRTGIIPSMIGNLKNLVLLDLDNNSLKGTVPASIGELPELKYLLLNRNQLEGSLPSTLSSLSKLAFFMIEKNNILGSADGVCSFTDVQEVFIADCAGSSPEVTCTCCTQCCSDGVDTCNEKVWLADSNPIWELGYARQGPVEFDTAGSRSYTVQFSGAIPP